MMCFINVYTVKYENVCFSLQIISVSMMSLKIIDLLTQKLSGDEKCKQIVSLGSEPEKTSNVEIGYIYQKESEIKQDLFSKENSTLKNSLT